METGSHSNRMGGNDNSSSMSSDNSGNHRSVGLVSLAGIMIWVLKRHAHTSCETQNNLIGHSEVECSQADNVVTKTQHYHGNLATCLVCCQLILPFMYV